VVEDADETVTQSPSVCTLESNGANLR